MTSQLRFPLFADLSNAFSNVCSNALSFKTLKIVLCALCFHTAHKAAASVPETIAQQYQAALAQCQPLLAPAQCQRQARLERDQAKHAHTLSAAKASAAQRQARVQAQAQDQAQADAQRQAQQAAKIQKSEANPQPTLEPSKPLTSLKQQEPQAPLAPKRMSQIQTVPADSEPKPKSKDRLSPRVDIKESTTRKQNPKPTLLPSSPAQRAAQQISSAEKAKVLARRKADVAQRQADRQRKNQKRQALGYPVKP